MPNHDLAIKWPDGKKSLCRIIKQKGIPLHGYPHHLRNPNGRVAVVQSDGKIGLLFKVSSISGPRKVKLANLRVRDNGYIVHAKPGTVKPPLNNELKYLSIKWRAIGQFRYFDAKSGRARLIDNNFGSSKDSDYMKEDVRAYGGHFRRPYTGGIPGKSRNNPEAKLVDAYVSWLNCPDRFGHCYLPGPRLHTDLFDRRYWRLIEAKACIDRLTLRTAVGQLLDYKRFFPRRPALGILLPVRPSKACMDYVKGCRITVIWRSPTGRFCDTSEDRRWTARI